MNAFDAVEIGAALQPSDRRRSSFFQTGDDLVRRKSDVYGDHHVIEHIKDAIGGSSKHSRRVSARITVEPGRRRKHTLDPVPNKTAWIFYQIEPTKASCFKRPHPLGASRSPINRVVNHAV